MTVGAEVLFEKLNNVLTCVTVFPLRHLEKMKKCYLVSSGERYLSTEILSKFKLLNGSRWTEEHLKNIQIEVIKPLLLYW